MATRPIIDADLTDRVTRRGLGRLPPFLVADGITWGQTFFGGAGYRPPTGMPAVCVADPPNTGWGTAFAVEDGDPFYLTLFHLWTMQSWRVPRDSHEMATFQSVGYETAFPFDRFRDALPRYYAEHKRRGNLTGDYATCARIMRAIGIEPPTDEELGAITPVDLKPVAQHAPKPPSPKGDGSEFKPVKRDGRRGEVLAFFLEGGTSANAAMAKFDITRSNLLSQLFLLNKNHGIGYHVKGDAISVELPEGVEDPFQ